MTRIAQDGAKTHITDRIHPGRYAMGVAALITMNGMAVWFIFTALELLRASQPEPSMGLALLCLASGGCLAAGIWYWRAGLLESLTYRQEVVIDPDRLEVHVTRFAPQGRRRLVIPFDTISPAVATPELSKEDSLMTRAPQAVLSLRDGSVLPLQLPVPAAVRTSKADQLQRDARTGADCVNRALGAPRESA
jgi:hypothetical protein